MRAGSPAREIRKEGREGEREGGREGGWGEKKRGGERGWRKGQICREGIRER